MHLGREECGWYRRLTTLPSLATYEPILWELSN